MLPVAGMDRYQLVYTGVRTDRQAWTDINLFTCLCRLSHSFVRHGAHDAALTGSLSTFASRKAGPELYRYVNAVALEPVPSHTANGPPVQEEQDSKCKRTSDPSSSYLGSRNEDTKETGVRQGRSCMVSRTITYL